MRSMYCIRFHPIASATGACPLMIHVRRSALVVAFTVLAFSAPASATIYPSAPQSPQSSDGVDGSSPYGFARSVADGQWGFVDVPAYSSCRYVTTGTKEDIPLGAASTWAGWVTTVSHRQGDQEVVCCRPQAPASSDFCQTYGGTPGGLSPSSLPYTPSQAVGGVSTTSVTVTTTCTDFAGQYQDTVTYNCGATGSGLSSDPTVDGLWKKSGADSATCTPNASLGACSVSCGGGTQTIYDSCGNATGSQSCNTQACCTTNYQVTATGACTSSLGCGGNPGTQSVTYTDFGTCNSGSYTTSQGCTTGACCQPNWVKSCNTTTATYTDANNCPGSTPYTVANGCTAYYCGCSGTCTPTTYTVPQTNGGSCTYTDCQYNWPCGGYSGCTHSGALIVTDCCTDPTGNTTCNRNVNAGVDQISCPATCYQ